MPTFMDSVSETADELIILMSVKQTEHEGSLAIVVLSWMDDEFLGTRQQETTIPKENVLEGEEAERFFVSFLDNNFFWSLEKGQYFDVAKRLYKTLQERYQEWLKGNTARTAS